MSVLQEEYEHKPATTKRNHLMSTSGIFFFFFFVPVKDFRWPCSSDSGIKFINNDLQTKHFELSVRCEQTQNGRKLWPCSPRYNCRLWLMTRGWRRIPSGAGPAAETPHPRYIGTGSIWRTSCVLFVGGDRRLTLTNKDFKHRCVQSWTNNNMNSNLHVWHLLWVEFTSGFNVRHVGRLVGGHGTYMCVCGGGQ